MASFCSVSIVKVFPFLNVQILVDDFSKMASCELYGQELYEYELHSPVLYLSPLTLPRYTCALRNDLIQREQLNFLKSAHHHYQMFMDWMYQLFT